MPQMAPLQWINLFMMFIITFTMMSSLNYFSFMYKTESSSSTAKKTQLSWTW